MRIWEVKDLQTNGRCAMYLKIGTKQKSQGFSTEKPVCVCVYICVF